MGRKKRTTRIDSFTTMILNATHHHICSRLKNQMTTDERCLAPSFPFLFIRSLSKLMLQETVSYHLAYVDQFTL
ncbi:Peroxide stress-activated histidine kinase mak1 [Fusarium oxysporum f. sp. albedinis]|nr:Peroxide stress-activated histidine kinase mak1 [Fusarium oxysporum f. sp. albedinis]